MVYMMSPQPYAKPPPVGRSGAFAEWLREARSRKGWSGERLAEEVETSQGTVSMYERGLRHPHRERAVELATALGADPREALEALMADTPGLEPVVEMERAVDEELLQDSLMAYTGDNPVLRAARRAALGEQSLMTREEAASAEQMASSLEKARQSGSVGGEGMPPVVVRGNGPVKKRIQKVDK